MKQTIHLLLFFCISLAAKSQSLEGRWVGYFTSPPTTLPAQRTYTETVIVSRDVKTGIERAGTRSVPSLRPDEIISRRIPEARIYFELDCISMPDSTYQFNSYTGEPVAAWTNMDYEIIGNDSIFLIEVRDTLGITDDWRFQKMMLHISWTKQNGKKVLRMKGPWSYAYGTKEEGEVVLYKKPKSRK